MSQVPPRYQLVVQRGPKPEQVFELHRDLVTIGRDIANHIVFSDPEVSRRHLRLHRTESGYQVVDLGSTNGTYVNQMRIHEQQDLQNDDLIGLGDTVLLRFQVTSAIYDIPSGDTYIGFPTTNTRTCGNSHAGSCGKRFCSSCPTTSGD